MRFFLILLTVVGPMTLLFFVVSPRDVLGDLSFIFDRRIIRRGFRLPRPRFARMKPIRFSLASILGITALVAVQQAWLLQFNGLEWVVMFMLTLFATFIFVASAILTSCNVPRRKHPLRYDHGTWHGPDRQMPKIDVAVDSRCPPYNVSCGAPKFTLDETASLES